MHADVIEPDSSDSEAREFEEDMKKAARTLPFFGKYFTCTMCTNLCYNDLLTSIIVDPNGKALGTMKILFGTQGGRLLRGENKPTLMPIHRLGLTAVNFYLMIITYPMMRIWYNSQITTSIIV